MKSLFRFHTFMAAGLTTLCLAMPTLADLPPGVHVIPAEKSSQEMPGSPRDLPSGVQVSSPVLAQSQSHDIRPPFPITRQSTPKQPVDIQPEVNPAASQQPDNFTINFRIRTGFESTVTFPNNILTVYFLEDGVIDVRALNARAVVITGKKDGHARVLVKQARYDGDTIGKTCVCRVFVTQPLIASGKGEGASVPSVTVPLTDTPPGLNVSPPVLPPSQLPNRKPPFPITTVRPPDLHESNAVIPKLDDKPRAVIPIKLGNARLLTTPANVLSLFFSDESVIDMRAINARTVVITGKAAGRATVALFTQRHKDDKVGQATVYSIKVDPNQSALPSLQSGHDRSSQEHQVTVPLDTARVSRMLGRPWPDGNKGFEEMLLEEIQKRDERIKELEKQLKERNEKSWAP